MCFLEDIALQNRVSDQSGEDKQGAEALTMPCRQDTDDTTLLQLELARAGSHPESMPLDARRWSPPARLIIFLLRSAAGRPDMPAALRSGLGLGRHYMQAE